MYFLETLQVCAPCHGGVLYSFWSWWNVVWIFYEFFKYWKNVFLTFYAISNISRKKNLGIQNNYFSFNVLSAGNIVKSLPLHLLVKWEVISPNRRYTCREFLHEVNWKVVSPDSTVGIYIQYIYNKNFGVSFWTCSREISGDWVALFSLLYLCITCHSIMCGVWRR